MTETTTIGANDLLWVWLDPAGANASRKIKASNLLKHYHSCEVVFGNPNPNASLLDAGDDQPLSCQNDSGGDEQIVGVACFVNTGTGTVVRPILRGSANNTSIVTGDITCSTSGQAGTLQSPAPVLHSYGIGANAATCTEPCSIDANLQAVDGVARYAIVRFTISGQ